MVPRAPESVFRLLIAALLMSAGCTALLPSDGERTATLTPASVPPEPLTLAPGVTANGVVNATVLGIAHNNTLIGRSYTVHHDLVVRYPNGTVHRGFHAVTQVEANQMRIRTTVTHIGEHKNGLKRKAYWVDEERIVIAKTYEDGMSIYATTKDRHPAIPIALARPGEVYTTGIFQNTTTRVAGTTTQNGTTLYRVIATNLTAKQLGWLPSFNPPPSESGTMQALIDRRGFVHQYNTTYETTVDGNTTVTVSSAIRYSNVNSTTVTRPEWYDDTRANTTATDGT